MPSFNRAWMYSFLAILVILFGAGTVWASQYFAWFEYRIKPTKTTSTPVAYTVQEVARGLDIPWSIVFTDPNRMLIAERPGKIKVLVDGKFADNPVVYEFKEVSTTGEEGLMSLVLDPKYKDNKILYAAVAYSGEGRDWVKVVSMVDRGPELQLGKIIIDKIPAAKFHSGTALAFGPDEKLYITTGDATDKEQAQNLDSLSGKILRINPDGTIPTDNPYPNSSVFSYGHRNGQGLAWHPNGKLYESEHGPSLIDGAAGGDEINLIEPKKNYGWPLVSHNKRRDGTEFPLRVFTPAEAPASLMVYTGNALPQFKNNLFFGALKGEGLVRLVLDPKNPSQITRVEKLADVEFGRIRAVAQGPDGAIYFSTSNLDGRGSPADTDDHIFKIQAK